MESLLKYFRHDGTYLEIGPLVNPFLKKNEYNVSYLDFRDTAQLREDYKNSYVDVEEIVDIDYPTQGKSYLQAVGETRFDGVFSSNCVEHTHDFLGHLLDVASILNEHGIYAMVVPNADRSMDFFRSPTSTREVINVHTGGSLNGFVADNVMNSAWWELVEDWRLPLCQRKLSFIPHLFKETIENHVDYIKNLYFSNDIHITEAGNHNWVFTYESFLTIIRDCLRLNILPFTVEFSSPHLNDTLSYSMQVVLKKNSKIMTDSSLRLREIIYLQSLIEKGKGFSNPWLEILSGTEKHVYIYGAGYYGQKLLNILNEIGVHDIEFIVSDDHDIQNDTAAVKMHKLSEIQHDDNVLILIGVLNKTDRTEIVNNLIKHGFKNYYHFY